MIKAHSSNKSPVILIGWLSMGGEINSGEEPNIKSSYDASDEGHISEGVW